MYIALHRTGQSKAASGKKSHDARQCVKLKNLFYGSMLLSGTVWRQSADPKFADVFTRMSCLEKLFIAIERRSSRPQRPWPIYSLLQGDNQMKKKLTYQLKDGRTEPGIQQQFFQKCFPEAVSCSISSKVSPLCHCHFQNFTHTDSLKYEFGKVHFQFFTFQIHQDMDLGEILKWAVTLCFISYYKFICQKSALP